MVRLDKCVEAFYDSVSADSRTKNLQILKVMKGAISMSRSKTGECIFRTNKSEKKNLERVIRNEGRTSRYNLSVIDAHRKQVLSRWSKVLEHQTSCTSEALFEELMEIPVNNTDQETDLHHAANKADSPEPRDYKLKNLIDLRLTKLDNECYTSGYTEVMASRRRRIVHGDNIDKMQSDTNNEQTDRSTEFITERKEIRGKYIKERNTTERVTSEDRGRKLRGTVLSKSKSMRLPAIHRGTASVPPPAPPSDTHPPLERDYTDWSNWSLKDTSRINGYLRRERTRHEDLIIRNALNRIETEMSGSNAIKRQQMRQKLQNERLKRRERAQKEAEVACDVEMSSANVEVFENNELASTKPIPLVKRVVFKEPLSVSDNNNKQNRLPSTQCRQKPRMLYTTIPNNVTNLPAIQERPKVLNATLIHYTDC